VPDVVSLWPLLELGYGVLNQTETSTLGANTHNASRSWIQVSLPILYHVAPPLFVGVGPSAYFELSDSDQSGYENKATQLGASFLLGGSI
jgi:hypothetical protein